jgi:predicted nucleic acid-binding protein
MRVVVDANIAFRALAYGRGDLRTRMGSLDDGMFFAPFFVLVELYKHKERIQRQSALAEEAVLTALHELCEYLTFIREAEIAVGTWVEACRLTKDVDPKDAPYVALTLHLGAKLWTHDAELKQGLRAKGFDEFWEP